jgi:tRNA wybutosine-synthesizing protein 2
MGYLLAALRDVLTPEELEFLPNGFDRIGHVAIIGLPPQLKHRSAEVGRALLRLKGVRTVALKGEVVGRCRMPQLKIIAGERFTETTHREHGCIFKLDVSRVMFSVGNLYERGRIAKLVRPGETVVDMFAGVGQFSIPIAKHSEAHKVFSIELNPVAYGYLYENIRLNKVGSVVKPLLGDCEKVAPRGVADRVVMGILHVTHRYLPLAIQVLKPSGGVIHYHESAPHGMRFERPVERILAAADGRRVEILNKRLVKRYAPAVDHVVIDAKIS